MVSAGDVAGHGQITADGADVAEGNTTPAISITLDQSSTVNVSNSQNVAIGDNNTQHWQGQFEALVKQIDASDATHAEKLEAKSKLSEFLAHPLVVSLIGAVAGKLLLP